MRISNCLAFISNKIRSKTYRRLPDGGPGFTLVELLVYMAILSVVLVAMTQIFSSLVDVRLESSSTSSVEEDSQYILSKLMYDIHKAQAISDPTTPGSTSETLQLTIDNVLNTYSLQNDNLVVASASSDMMNGYDTKVSNLSFTRIGNSSESSDSKDTIQISFTVTSRVQRSDAPESKTVTSTIGIR